MTQEEDAILALLESNPEVFFARKEIARRAVKRKVYEENPHWADAALASLAIQKLIEQNDSGQYRSKHEEQGRCD